MFRFSYFALKMHVKAFAVKKSSVNVLAISIHLNNLIQIE